MGYVLSAPEVEGGGEGEMGGRRGRELPNLA